MDIMRKPFFKYFILLVAMLSIASVSQADKVYKLKLAETWGPNFPIFGDASKSKSIHFLLVICLITLT